MLTGQRLAEHFDQHLTTSAFRLETLSHYDVGSDGADFERFLAGEPAPTAERKKPWLDHLRAEKAAGIRRYRVHTLTTPLTDYLRYECEWGYVLNEEAGEEIYIADWTGRDAPALGIDHDFWLLDDEHVLAMQYDEQGRFQGAEIPDDVEPYRQARDLSLTIAEPFGAWWSRHPEEWRNNRP